MSLFLILLLIAQTGANLYTSPSVYIDKPSISVTGFGKYMASTKATEYKIILYADAYGEKEKEARALADALKKEIINTVEKLGGEQSDVVLINLNVVQPVEGDPYYRIEQDIETNLKNVENINKVRESFLLINGVQIGTFTPIINETTEYTAAVEKARQDAIKNAKQEANDLARALGVALGEPIYVYTYPKVSIIRLLSRMNLRRKVILQYQ